MSWTCSTCEEDEHCIQDLSEYVKGRLLSRLVHMWDDDIKDDFILRDLKM
jgi:hypothetical protein